MVRLELVGLVEKLWEWLWKRLTGRVAVELDRAVIVWKGARVVVCGVWWG